MDLGTMILCALMVSLLLNFLAFFAVCLKSFEDKRQSLPGSKLSNVDPPCEAKDQHRPVNEADAQKRILCSGGEIFIFPKCGRVYHSTRCKNVQNATPNCFKGYMPCRDCMKALEQHLKWYLILGPCELSMHHAFWGQSEKNPQWHLCFWCAHMLIQVINSGEVPCSYSAKVSHPHMCPEAVIPRSEKDGSNSHKAFRAPQHTIIGSIALPVLG